MTKILLFTDIHVTHNCKPIIRLDPAQRFADGLSHALAHHPDAEGIVIMGDLTHHGITQQYTQLRWLLADCPIPVHLMLGNHDDRVVFLQEFPDSPRTDAGFVQFSLNNDGHRLICLDTKDANAPDRHSGWLCAERLDWLAGQLQTDRMVTVLTHHPPFDSGFQGMDAIKLRNGDQLLALLQKHGVQQLISGHIHRTIMGNIGGLPIAMLKSTCHQMPMDLNAAGTSHSVDEPGAYGVLRLTDVGAVLIPEDFTLPAPDRRFDPYS